MSRPSKEQRQRLLEEEHLIAEGTELIAQLLEVQEVSRQELAKRLGKSKGFVSQVLSGERNMTMRTLAAFAFALGTRVELSHAPLGAHRKYLSISKEPEAPQHLGSFQERLAQRAARERPRRVRKAHASHKPGHVDVATAVDENHSFALGS